MLVLQGTGMYDEAPLVGFVSDMNNCEKCGHNCNENKVSAICCNDKNFDNICCARCAGYQFRTQCVDGVCAPDYDGLFSLNTDQQYTTQNIIIITIQLLVLSICCLGIGCILPLVLDQYGIMIEKKVKEDVLYAPDL